MEILSNLRIIRFMSWHLLRELKKNKSDQTKKSLRVKMIRLANYMKKLGKERVERDIWF